MPKIRIRDHKPNQGNRKILLWNRLMTNNLLVYRVEDQNRSHFVVISSDEVIEKLLTPKIKETLQKDDFEVLTPPQFNANRTLVVRNVDSIITSIEEDELKNDIERRNDWAKVSDVIKIPNAPKLLKIKFENASMTKAACDKGILIYNQSFPPSSVERDIFIQLIPCYKCYKYDHKSEACITPNVTLCSECAADDHIYRNCRSENKKCLNCKGNHRTFAARCPVRKNLINERKKEIRERSRSRSRSRSEGRTPTYSYAQATQRGTNAVRGQIINFERTDYVKIASSIVFAHIMEGVVPGSFHQNIKEMYKLNGLPEVKFPENIPPPNVPQSELTERLRDLSQGRESQEDEIEIEQETVESEMEIEREKRKREITPSPKEIRDPRLKRRETRQEEEIHEPEAPPCPPPSPQEAGVAASKVKKMGQTEATKPKEPATRPKVKLSQSDEETLKKYARYQKEMNFIMIKTKNTVIRKGDMQELNQLIRERRLKYIYSNPAYSESDVRVLWEKGLADIRSIEIKEVNQDFFNSIERNGQLVRGRKTSVSSAK